MSTVGQTSSQTRADRTVALSRRGGFFGAFVPTLLFALAFCFAGAIVLGLVG